MFNNAPRQLRPALFPWKHLDLAAARAKLALPDRAVEKQIPYSSPTPTGEELPGDHVTEAMVKEWIHDKFRRSKWNTNGPAVRSWAKLEE